MRGDGYLRLEVRVLTRLGLILSAIAAGGFVLAAMVTFSLPAVGAFLAAGEGKQSPLEMRPLATRSLVLAADGSVLASLHGEENRAPVPLERIPREIVDAVVAVEDENFFEHPGVDLKATLRALVKNVQAGGVRQGGSTITMQLVKNALLDPRREVDRKLKEVVLALRIESELSKEEILERYLNTVYFGGGAYGVQAAAEIYWQKPVEELSWPEAAMLAGLIRNPTGYDPTLYPERARERRRQVLDRLVEVGLISREQAERYDEAPLPREKKQVLPQPDDYFVAEVVARLLRDRRLGDTYQEREDAVFRGGLVIETTLNPTAQRMAEEAIAEVLPPEHDPFTVALVAVEPSTGAVRAMVGGPGFDRYKYNIATHRPGRQTGSAFKAFVVAAAMENGLVPGDRVDGGGRFPNPGGEPDPYEIEGPGGSIEKVTAESSNGAFVRLGQIVGLDRVVDVARRLGVTAHLDPSVISMPLGVFEVTPLEMASAFAAFAAEGIRNPPYFVQRVSVRRLDDEGNEVTEVLFEREPSGTRALSRQTACLTTQVLREVVEAGTGTRARIGRQPAAGKTGTTQDFADAWFVGYTPRLSTAVWMGAPNERIPMRNVGGVRAFGGTFPAAIWGAFNRRYHEGLPVEDFPDCEVTRSPRYVRIGSISRLDGDAGGDYTTRSSRTRSRTSRDDDEEPVTRRTSPAEPATTSTSVATSRDTTPSTTAVPPTTAETAP